jgi:hypothetical protein
MGHSSQRNCEYFDKKNQMLEAFIKAVGKCESFGQGNILSSVLPSIDKISSHQADELVGAYNKNSELQGSFGFSGTKPRLYGKGLVFHLNRLTNRNYKFSASGTIETPTTIF